MKPPAFQLYADDLIAGTIKFTDGELGLYMRLLCAQWSEGSLPDDDAELSSYGRGKTPLARVKSKFHKGPDGRLRNQRMEAVRQEQNEYRENRREAGKKGNEIRWGEHRKAIAEQSHSDCNGIAKHIAKHRSPSPPPSPTIKTTKLISDKGAGKALAKLNHRQRAMACDIEKALATQWTNDAGKWINRIKSEPLKTERVMAEVVNAIKEERIKTTPAQYAEQIWKEFK